MKRQTGLKLISKVLEKNKHLSTKQQAEAVLQMLEKKQLIAPPETVVEFVMQDGVKTPVMGLEWSKSKKELNQEPLRHIFFKNN